MPTTRMTPQEIEQRKAQIADLSMCLADATESADHSMALEALLHLYIVMAEMYGCCTRPAALACVAAAARLQKTAIYRAGGAMLH